MRPIADAGHRTQSRHRCHEIELVRVWPGDDARRRDQAQPGDHRVAARRDGTELGAVRRHDHVDAVGEPDRPLEGAPQLLES